MAGTSRGTPAGKMGPSNFPGATGRRRSVTVRLSRSRLLTMSAVVTSLCSRWHDPRHPLYLAALFQVVIFGLIWAGLPFAAVGLAGGTIGCLIASLRLQGEQRRRPEPLAT